MISISQIISILCLHSTYITHRLKKGGTKEETELYQLQMFCPPRPDPAVHLPPGIFHTRHIAGDQSLRNKCSTSPPLKGRIPKMAKKDELQTKRAERNTDPLISSMCYSSAP